MLSRSLIQKLNTVDSIFIPHPRIKRVIDHINQSILIAEGSVESPNTLLIGNAGTGKSTVARALLKQHPRSHKIIESNKHTIIPLFYALVPSPVTPKGLASAMLSKLGDIAPTRGTTLDLTERLIQLILACQTQIILLDEFQHLLLNTHNHKMIRDWVKDLINKTGVPIVIIGTPACTGLISSSSQLSRRFAYRMQLTNLTIDDAIDVGEYLDFILCLKRGHTAKLDVEYAVEFAERRTRLAIYVATGGNPADITRLFKEATFVHLETESDYIGLNEFKYAFNRIMLFNSMIKANPFEMNASRLKKIILNNIDRNGG